MSWLGSLIGGRVRWLLAGMPIAAIAAVLCTCSVDLTHASVRPRQLTMHVASMTMGVDTKPGTTIDGNTFLFELQVDARFVERIVWSPATLRRLAAKFDIPPNQILGTAAPSRIEQLPERSHGTRDQRSYAVVRETVPFVVTSDGYLSDPLLRVSVRAPSIEQAQQILAAVPQAVNDELDALAGGKGRSELEVKDPSGISVSTTGVPVAKTTAGIAFVLYVMWLVLGLLLFGNPRTPRRQRARGLARGRRRREGVRGVTVTNFLARSR